MLCLKIITSFVLFLRSKDIDSSNKVIVDVLFFFVQAFLILGWVLKVFVPYDKITEGTKQVENEAVDTFFFSNLNTPKTIGGKASLQPKRTPVSNEEMEAILLGGCI